MLHSMTGFAREADLTEIGALSIEIRSVNHRYLDVTFKMPESLRNFEPALRERLKKGCQRGKIDISVRLDQSQSVSQGLTFNHELAQQLIAMHQEAQVLTKSDKSLSPSELLRYPNVLMTTSPDIETVKPTLLALFDRALTSVNNHRQSEGERITAMVEERLDKMRSLLSEAEEQRPHAIQHIRTQLLERLESLKVEHDSYRFEQELVYITQRLDIDEEIDRLKSHLEEISTVLKRQEPVGRRLDFLAQELNREANTLGSKSQDAKLTQISVDLKVLIEQIREQIQNVE